MDPVAPVQPQQSKSKLPIIIGVVVVALCCCCIAVIGGFMLLGPAVGNVFSSIESDLGSPSIPDLDDGDSINPSDVIPGIDQYMAIPEGGYGDETLRTNTWGYVLTLAMIAGCETPDAAGTYIDVTVDIDSAGVWQERWTVACGGDVTKPFLVDYTPDPNGGYTINVKEDK